MIITTIKSKKGFVIAAYRGWEVSPPPLRKVQDGLCENQKISMVMTDYEQAALH